MKNNALPIWSKYGFKSSDVLLDDGMFVRAHAFAVGFDKGMDCNFELMVILSLLSFNIFFSHFCRNVCIFASFNA